ncbi:MarC family protein [Geobacter sp. DSM 9736]|uniref:MarC family protein n=1 Tax=Geobacter sp. DSM 9736 TaxID=1277350 RepID=UPI000B4FE2D8|nr:MarC family protein [Geobacter sp. DSM 9736]SNB48066.1 membrane protein, MarC family [Geobacter sp. DSM 9736]
MTFTAAVILFILVMDPLGGIPFFIAALRKVPLERKKKVIAREMLIALTFLILFMFLGPKILKLLSISGPSLTIAGGIILLLIAIKMIFPGHQDCGFETLVQDEPLIVPLAIPYVSGPSALATVMLVVSREPQRWPEWLLALVVAWLITGIILMMCVELENILGERGVVAIERLMGMILTAIAVEMTLTGVHSYLTLLAEVG